MSVLEAKLEEENIHVLRQEEKTHRSRF